MAGLLICELHRRGGGGPAIEVPLAGEPGAVFDLIRIIAPDAEGGNPGVTAQPVS